MGFLYETLSTPGIYARKALCRAHAPGRHATRVSFGDDRNQAFVYFEPEKVTHDTVVMYFHGGGYLIGTPESMGTVADVFNAWGYRFVSVGFGLLPAHPFPSQVTDAFCGVLAAMGYLEENGIPCESILLGGNSAGGHAAAMVAYARDLQRACDLDTGRIRGVISMAGVMDITDLLARGASVSHLVDFPGVDPCDGDALRRALERFSPIELIDPSSAVPFLALHGRYDRMSPYESEVRFVRRLNSLAGEGTATLYTIEDWRYQHLRLTAGVYTEDPATSETLTALAAWLDMQDFA